MAPIFRGFLGAKTRELESHLTVTVSCSGAVLSRGRREDAVHRRIRFSKQERIGSTVVFLTPEGHSVSPRSPPIHT